MGEVLHHALQPRAALERGARVVPVLGVHKLCDDAMRRLQRRQVALRLQQQLVDVSCIATPPPSVIQSCHLRSLATIHPDIEKLFRWNVVAC